MKGKQILKKAESITASVLLCVFMAACLFGVILTVSAKKDSDGTATVFGMQMRLVQSPSMEKCDATNVSSFDIKDIPVRSMVFIELVPEDAEAAKEWYFDLKEGDVLTFKYVYARQETITHRITSKKENGAGGYIIELEGDNKSSESGILTQTIDTSQTNSPNYVIGKVVGQSYVLGLFVSALKSSVGLICIVIIPSLAIVIFEIARIVNVLSADKRKKQEEEKAQKQREIDELKRRLTELEKSAAPQTSNSDGSENSNSYTNGEKP